MFGHSLYYWHQNVLIRHSETLKREYRLLLLDYPDGFVEINTDDAKRLGIRDGDRIRLSTAGGSLTSTARVTSEVRSGTAFVPYFVRQLKRRNARRDRRQQIARSGARGKGEGMKARIVDQADVLKIVDLLRGRGYEVIAPFCGRGRDSYFDTRHRRESSAGADSSAQSVLSSQALRLSAHRALDESPRAERRNEN